MPEKHIQIKMSTFTKMMYVSMKLTDYYEVNDNVLDEATYNDLEIIKNDLHERWNAKKAREEYSKKFKEDK